MCQFKQKNWKLQNTAFPLINKHLGENQRQLGWPGVFIKCPGWVTYLPFDLVQSGVNIFKITLTWYHLKYAFNLPLNVKLPSIYFNVYSLFYFQCWRLLPLPFCCCLCVSISSNPALQAKSKILYCYSPVIYRMLLAHVTLTYPYLVFNMRFFTD